MMDFAANMELSHTRNNRVFTFFVNENFGSQLLVTYLSFWTRRGTLSVGCVTYEVCGVGAKAVLSATP